MTTTMAWSAMLTVLVHIFLVSQGARGWQPDEEASLRSGALDLPWRDELCCDSPAAHLGVGGGATHVPETNGSESNLPHRPRCSFRSSTTGSHSHELSSGICLDILCRIDENWENLTCELESHGSATTTQDAGLLAVSLQHLFDKADTELRGVDAAADNPVVCEAEDSFMCSISLNANAGFLTVVTVSISDAVAPPVPLRIPARPVKPGPPVNLSHHQTIEAELILIWDNPSDFDTVPLTCEARYSSNTTHPDWQVVTAPEEASRLSLDLKPLLYYTIQVRCSALVKPPLWSDWSEPHHIRLEMVTYIPELMKVQQGDNMTVYCIYNDHSSNASLATWILDLHHPLSSSHYRAVHPRVSQITMRPSETYMYAMLRCTQEWTLPYSAIYVEGAPINIECKTNGYIDAMECSWNPTQSFTVEFRSRWVDLSCDDMEMREKMGEELGEMVPGCKQVGNSSRSCTIAPVRNSCYRMWLVMSSPLGPIRSKPIYLSPINYVKPLVPTNVKAVTQSNGVLMVTWQPPQVPPNCQCQFQYRSTYTVRAQWKLQSPVQVPWAEVPVPDMCDVYEVKVRCISHNGTGYWSDWSSEVYSTPLNSRAPERGPDFWRILQDDEDRNQTNVTLLFEHPQISGQSYCVEGFVIQHRTSSGTVTTEQVDLTSSYRFEWNQMPQTVTVKAYNSLGRSANNINMTLERRAKRHCVQSFSAVVINSTCVSVSWTLFDNSSVPLFMVVQWSSQRQQGLSGDTWARLPYTNRPTYLRGDFPCSEDCGFYLYPVFANGEGEPVYTTATRGDPAAYMLLMIISFLSIVLFVTLVLSQNHMRKFVWKDVPNPNKCSWAKGLDFKKTDTFDHLFRPPEGLTAWPLLLPSENLSKVVIMDKVDLSALTTALVQAPLVSLTPDPATALSVSIPPGFDSEVGQALPLEGQDASFALHLDDLRGSNPRIDQMVNTHEEQAPRSTDSSAQSSVAYATVLLSEPKQEEQPIHLHYKDGSGSSSSDEGNFSANNSDISGSFHGGLWELDDPRRSRSYNSVEELSETSEQEDEEVEEVRGEKDLYYLGMDYPAEDEESEEDEEQRGEETEIELLKSVVLNREDCSVESRPLLGPEDSSGLLSPSTRGFSPLYLPQFRTAPCTRQHTTLPQEPRAAD